MRRDEHGRVNLGEYTQNSNTLETFRKIRYTTFSSFSVSSGRAGSRTESEKGEEEGIQTERVVLSCSAPVSRAALAVLHHPLSIILIRLHFQSNSKRTDRFHPDQK